MTYLQQNIDALRTHAPALVAALKDCPGGVLTITASREGAPSATVRGQWVHSAYDPRKEARVWAEDQLSKWRPGEVGVVLGVGLLYHVEAVAIAKPPGPGSRSWSRTSRS